MPLDALWRHARAFLDFSFFYRLTLDVNLIGFGDLLTALCLPSPTSQDFDKDFDQNHNTKMLSAQTQYMTLGPKFFSCNKMTITRRIKHLRTFQELSRKALDVYYNLALSKHDLKPSATFSENLHATLDSQVTVFNQSLHPEGDLATKLYTSDKENVEIETAYTSDQTMLKSK